MKVLLLLDKMLPLSTYAICLRFRIYELFKTNRAYTCGSLSFVSNMFTREFGWFDYWTITSHTKGQPRTVHYSVKLKSLYGPVMLGLGLHICIYRWSFFLFFPIVIRKLHSTTYDWIVSSRCSATTGFYLSVLTNRWDERCSLHECGSRAVRKTPVFRYRFCSESRI